MILSADFVHGISTFSILVLMQVLLQKLKKTRNMVASISKVRTHVLFINMISSMCQLNITLLFWPKWQQLFSQTIFVATEIFWRFSTWHLRYNDSKLCNLAICLVQILLLEFGFVLANESMKVMRSSSSRELLQSSQAGPFGMAPCHMCQLKAVAPHFGLKDANIQGQKFISEAEDSSFFALFSRISQKSIQWCHL